jgi:hypothetical protein
VAEEQENNSLFRPSLPGAKYLLVISHIDRNFQLTIQPTNFSLLPIYPKHRRHPIFYIALVNVFKSYLLLIIEILLN